MADELSRDDLQDEWNTRAGRRRMRLEFQERAERFRTARNSYLDQQLEPGEAILARSVGGTAANLGPKAISGTLVTDRRILFAWRRAPGPHTGEWTHDAIRYSEVQRWTLGRQHDARPLIVVEHPVHVRLQSVQDERTLFWRHGNGEGPVEYTQTTFPGASDRHPVFVAMRDQLERANIPRGEPFEIRPKGTRQERIGGRNGYFLEARRFPRLRIRMRLMRDRWGP